MLIPPANLEVKSKAPNGVTFNVKGKSAHEGPISGSVSTSIPVRKNVKLRGTDKGLQLEGKYVDKGTGEATTELRLA
jgi:hypothetical protein